MELLVVLVIITILLVPILQFVLIGKSNRISERLENQEQLLFRIWADQLADKQDQKARESKGGETQIQEDTDRSQEKAESITKVKEATASPTADDSIAVLPVALCEPPSAAIPNQEPECPPEVATEETPSAPEEQTQLSLVESGFYEEENQGESAIDLFFSRISNWLSVSGEFAPKGMTREFAFVTRWLLRIGMLLIVASIAYFLKLSIDRGWVGPSQRVFGTVLFGLAMSGYGAWLIRRTNYGPIGHALAAIGFAALYLGFGMAHRYFDPPVIASSTTAFVILAGVTVFGTALAVFLNSSTISLLSLIGGYLVPILTQHNPASPSFLYLYLSLLNLGIVAVSWIRRWSALNFLAACSAYAMSFLCYNRFPHVSGYAVSTLIFLSVIHTIYLLSVLVSQNRLPRAANVVATDVLAWCGLILNAILMTGWTATLLTDHYGKECTGWMLLALSALYALLAKIQIIRDKENRICSNLLILISFALLWMTPMFFFENIKCAPCWCLLSVATAIFANRTDQEILRILARVTAVSCAIIALVNWGENNISNSQDTNWLIVLGMDIIHYGCVPILFAFLGYNEKSKTWKYTMNACAILTGFIFLTAETSRLMYLYLPRHEGGAITTVWGLYASSLLTAGIIRRVKSLRVVGLVILGICVCKLLLVDTVQLDTPWRVALFAITGGLLIAGASLYLKYRKSFSENENG